MPETFQKITYGGEAELLSVDKNTRRLTPISYAEQHKAADRLRMKDNRGNQADLGYDSSFHLAEVGVGIWGSLPEAIYGLHEAVTALQGEVSKRGAGFISSSHHPIDNLQRSYNANVLPKPLYDVLRGKRGGQDLYVEPSVLSKVYPTNSEKGRGWNHEVGTMAASLQPWNSLQLENAAKQIKVLQATGWMFNLLTANSPYIEGNATGRRDSRLNMWGSNGIMATSRYDEDRNLIHNIPEEPTGLSDYYNYVLSNQRLAVVPYKQIEGERGEYKMRFLALVQPPESEEFNALSYLSSDTVKAVDIETGDELDIKPNVAHIFNGFDFLYFPRYGARLRVSLPYADTIDSKAFARAVQDRDENTLLSLMREGGIDTEGFICAEGRVAATVLPTIDHPSWDRFNLPFVLQTALVRSAGKVEKILKASGLSWHELSVSLPELTNDSHKGFNTKIRGVEAAALAMQIWQSAKESLTEEEAQFAGSAIETMLQEKQGPAEEQMNYVEKLLRENPSLTGALIALIDHQVMVIPK